VDVYGLTGGFAAVVSGGYHSCALTDSGAVYCWGSNQFGQLGDNTTISRISPVQVYGLSQGVMAIAAGSYHTCAMTASQVLCWGNNTYGQLGSGNRLNYSVPVAVVGINHPPIKITTGTNHSCAIQDNGVVKCWGFNRNGQLGNGTRDDVTTATVIEGVTGIDFIDVSAGDRHTCAITDTGGVMCWGLNVYGQLGDGSITLSPIPVQVIGLDQRALELALGDDHSCIIIEDGSVRCWGSNVNGQLGDSTTNDEWYPIATVGLGGKVLSLNAGGHHTCVQLEGSNMVQCFGDNQSGQLGDDSTITRLTPVNVSGLNASWVGAGSQTTCAVTLEGAVKCWGTNAQGQVGDGSLPWTLSPSLVKDLVAASLEINYTAGYPGSYFTLHGGNFAGVSEAVIRVNNVQLNPTMQTDSNGGLIFLLDSSLAEPGGYVVSVEAGETRNMLFHVDLNEPLHAIEDSGPIYQIPGDIALTFASYLPWGAK
jgi:alpha-tubulin suppressor-like RCC1 family protein